MSATDITPHHESTLDRPTGVRALSGTDSRESTRKHIRGSGLLLFGRMISLALNLATQVIIARYLSKHEFGAFAYALSAVAFAASVISLGLDKSAQRFVAIYHERGDMRLWGTILLSMGTVLALGVLFVALIFGMSGLVIHQVGDQLSATLIFVLVGLAPIEALNRLCDGMTAVLGGPRAIFVRRHIAGPGLRCGMVVLLVGISGSAYVLAIGYLVTGIIGTAAYLAYLLHLLRRLGLWRQFQAQGRIVPAREILGFSLPLLSSDVATTARGFLAVYLLGLFYAPAAVAVFRVVVPLAGLNKIVFETFQFLYMPLASRLFARNDRTGLDQLYWRSALWITLLTFPIFLVTFVLAEPFTTLLVGMRYRQSASVLTWLSLGYFINTVLGFNTLTLKVFGDVRNIVRNDALDIVVTVALYLLLIPPYGAVGAAIANCAAITFHNVLNQVSLLRIAGISFFPLRYLGLYGVMVLTSLGLYVIQVALTPPLYVGIPLVAFASGLVFLFAREMLDIGAMFPELTRLPIVRHVFRLSSAPS